MIYVMYQIILIIQFTYDVFLKVMSQNRNLHNSYNLLNFTKIKQKNNEKLKINCLSTYRCFCNLL